MQGEQILKVGRLVYAKLFDDFGNTATENFCFQDKNGEYDCIYFFWRFFYIK